MAPTSPPRPPLYCFHKSDKNPFFLLPVSHVFFQQKRPFQRLENGQFYQEPPLPSYPPLKRAFLFEANEDPSPFWPRERGERGRLRRAERKNHTCQRLPGDPSSLPQPLERKTNFLEGSRKQQKAPWNSALLQDSSNNIRTGTR